VDVKLGALAGPAHSGSYGGAAPDPVAGLLAMLASLHDEEGNTTVDGVDASGRWEGADYAPEQFRADAQVLDGVELIGSGSVADMVWARPAATVIGIDVPPVAGSVNAIQAGASARVSLRVPPGQSAQEAQDALVEHLRRRVPWRRASLSPARCRARRTPR
jgi:acetylornithine deacetylase/succinyl-diaminopimelate desuccinylase-like protein